jgi:hypothetical protein
MPRRSLTRGLTGVVSVTLAPPRGLTADERRIWKEFLGVQPPGMHGPADIPVLRLLVAAESKRRHLEADAAEYERQQFEAPTEDERKAARKAYADMLGEVRAQTATVTRLLTACRMTPGSRMDRSAPARMVAQDADRAAAHLEGHGELVHDWRREVRGNG